MKKNLHNHKSEQGFTLIEILIVVTILTVLAVSVFAALNPAQRLKDAKDARRSSDVQEVLTAIHQSIVDNKGSLPTNLAALTAPAERQLGTGNSTVCTTALVAKGCATPAATACLDLMTGAQNLGVYLKTMPYDPSGGTTYDATKTGYSVALDVNGIVTVKACNAEGTSNISASR